MSIFSAAVDLCLIVVLGYLAGSFPTSLIVSKVFKGIDIRKYGSGNAGGTNTLRVLGWKAALIVASVDIFKGFASAFWISRINLFHTSFNSPEFLPVLAGAAAVIGHCYPIFAGFRGGKGIAASAGMIVALSPAVLLIILTVFVSVLILTGYVSLSSLAAATALPVTLFIFRFVLLKGVSAPFLVFGVAGCAFIYFTHRANIKRLIEGRENRFNSVRLFARR
jgi:glycerol-3-phosphate acyltransferase PlsY